MITAYPQNILKWSGLLVVLMFFLGGMFASAVRADEYHNAAAAYCNPQKNQFLIRFGGYYNDDPPQNGEYGRYSDDVPKELLDKAIWDKNSCRLSNGQHIGFRIEDGFATGFGPGGAVADEIFFMKINGVNVYDGYIYQEGGGSSNPYASSIYYDGKKLIQCDMVYLKGQYYPQERTEMNCHDVSDRLDGKMNNKSEVDFNEYVKKFNDYRVINNDIYVCNYVDVKGVPGYLKNKFNYVDFDLLYKFKEQNEFKNFESDKCFDRIMYGDYDIDDDGVKNQVFLFDSNSGYFDGSFIIYSRIFNDNVKSDFIDMFCNDNGFEQAVYELEKNKSDFVAITDPNEDLRYTSVRPYVIDGRTYFLLARKGAFRLPLATLVSMSKDGKMNTVCTFK